MLKRIISGAVFVVIVVGCFLLREFVDYRLFNLLILFVCGMGTFEVARALKQKTLKNSLIFTTIYGCLVVPAFCIAEYWLIGGFGYLAVLGLFLAFAIFYLFYAIILKAKPKSYLITLLTLIYPALFVLTMLLANGLPNKEGFLAMALVFVIAPCSDTFAFFVGSALKGPKLCPKLSPKKTWSGAIGGVLGGGLGAIIVYFVFSASTIVSFNNPLLVFIIMGLLGSIFTQVGDLFESFIKRKVGIKDMGKIMPGHGGVMDRFDGMLFASVLIYFIFLIF